MPGPAPSAQPRDVFYAVKRSVRTLGTKALVFLALAVLPLAASEAQSGIDLTMTSLTGAPASVGVGKSFSVSNAVRTTGAVSTSVPRH